MLIKPNFFITSKTIALSVVLTVAVFRPVFAQQDPCPTWGEDVRVREFVDKKKKLTVARCGVEWLAAVKDQLLNGNLELSLAQSPLLRDISAAMRAVGTDIDLETEIRASYLTKEIELRFAWFDLMDPKDPLIFQNLGAISQAYELRDKPKTCTSGDKIAGGKSLHENFMARRSNPWTVQQTRTWLIAVSSCAKWNFCSAQEFKTSEFNQRACSQECKQSAEEAIDRLDPKMKWYETQNKSFLEGKSVGGWNATHSFLYREASVEYKSLKNALATCDKLK
ncbi:MAG: hypothetical protein ACK5RJ_14230 [Burkholderiales bacterium]|jgi:hypothetical protein|nr:hypothetical protein [Rhodocyclaceae bacterium]MCA3022600.1 hypothetical protein [Rhodocyclaceae bacterium]MCA3051810.1 hypothetical protein [Rhodocyclaceae bacterium]MCA3056384.1 hypothetical protein [Rhodocyclaceae bacterium]